MADNNKIWIAARPPYGSPHRVVPREDYEMIDCSVWSETWRALSPRGILDVADYEGTVASSLETFTNYIRVHPSWGHELRAGVPSSIWCDWKHAGFTRATPNPRTMVETWAYAWNGYKMTEIESRRYIDSIYCSRVRQTMEFTALQNIYALNNIMLLDIFPLHRENNRYVAWRGEAYDPLNRRIESRELHYSHVYALANLLTNL